MRSLESPNASGRSTSYLYRLWNDAELDEPTQGTGEVVITPSSVDGGGSHFATPNDEARWVALGKPFIPCALVSSTNQLSGNSANLNNEGSLGGYSSSVSGYGGFGLSLALASRTNLLSATTNVNNLPASPAAISNLLANGQIGTDGSETASAQVCPIHDGSNGAAEARRANSSTLSSS